jgi:hypothetical protein
VSEDLAPNDESLPNAGLSRIGRQDLNLRPPGPQPGAIGSASPGSDTGRSRAGRLVCVRELDPPPPVVDVNWERGRPSATERCPVVTRPGEQQTMRPCARPRNGVESAACSGKALC